MLTDYQHGLFVLGCFAQSEISLLQYFYTYSSRQSQEQQRGMIEERCKNWLNLLEQQQKPGFGLNHQAREGWGRFSVVPTLQRPNIFCIGLTSHWFLFYLLVILVILSVLQMHICVPWTFSAVYIAYHKLRANRNLTKSNELVNLSVTCRTKNGRIDF